MPVKARERPNGTGNRQRIEQESNQFAGGEIARQHPPSAHPHHDGKGPVPDQLHEGGEDGLQFGPLQGHHIGILHLAAVAAYLRFLGGEPFHDPVRSDGLFGGGIGVGNLVLVPGRDAAQPASEGRRGDDGHGQERQHHHRQSDIGQKHQRHAADQGDGLRDRRGQRRRGHGLDHRHIRRQPGGDFTGLAGVEELDRQRHDVPVHGPAKIGNDPLTHCCQVVDPQVAKRRLGSEDAEQQHGDAVDLREILEGGFRPGQCRPGCR